ncbi:MAG: carboxypeptidase regulatory-like domain-containing protein [Planctomycetes bacterium]|nr:carboxypeptidase regulatory-like domain-containing protein [Planctomycetota bacterium]
MRTFLLSRCCAAFLAMAPVTAQSLTGRLVSPANVPLAGIVVDAGSGTTPATSDATGTFTLTGLQNGNDYDVEFVPPFAAPWAARMQTVVVNGVTDLGDVVLQPGFVISGVARNEAGQPVPGCNLNAYTQDGTKLFTPRDGTDLTGSFAIVVPAGTLDVRVVPPVGALLVPRQIEDVVVGAAVPLGDVLLRTAYLVTGSVVDQASGLPIGSTRLRAVDALTGERIVLPNELTNTFGQFSLPLPFGIMDLEVTPPVGNTHVARQLYGVLVFGSQSLGQVRLQNGALLSGTVLRGGLPAAGVDIDVLLPDGGKIVTPRDATAANGTFSVAVPTGVALRVRVEPQAGDGSHGIVSAPVTLAGPTSLGSLVLPAGLAVSGVVQGPLGPEPGASVRFFKLPEDVQVVTAGSTTGAGGGFATFVPPGDYRVDLVPAEGSVAAPQSQFVTIAATTVLNPVLAAKGARCVLTGFGTLTMTQGGWLPLNAMLHNLQPGGGPLLLDLGVELPDGSTIWLAYGEMLDLPPFPVTVIAVFVPLPIVPTPFLGRPIDMVLRLRDLSGANVLDTAKTPFVVE